MSDNYMQLAAQAVDEKLKEHDIDACFCLLVLPKHAAGIANYIANVERNSMIKALRETADRLEKNQDNRRGQN